MCYFNVSNKDRRSIVFKRPPSYPRQSCGICKTLRVVVAMAVFVLVLASFSFDLGLLKGIQFTDMFAAIIGAGFVLVLGWRIWIEFIRKG